MGLQLTKGLRLTDRGVLGGGFRNQYALRFDGTDEGLIAPHSGPINFDTNDAWSVSLWLKVVNFNGSNVILFEKRSTGAVNKGFIAQLRASDGLLRLVKQADSGGATDTSITDSDVAVPSPGSYNHIGISSVDGSPTGVDFYLNGALFASTELAAGVAGDMTNTENFYIGNTNDIAGGGFNAIMDEFEIFNYKLSAAQWLEIYNGGTPLNMEDYTGTQPLRNYRMGEGASYDGTNWTIPDIGTEGLDATTTNMEEADRVTDTP